MVAKLAIRFSPQAVAEVCRRFGVKRLAALGSVLRDDFDNESDVDVLFEFEPGSKIGLEIVDLEDELSNVFGGRKIDLVPFKYISPLLRDRVLKEAQMLYGA